jgi:hypothetical protein
MPVTCPYCKAHFPKSDVINSRHKDICDGWKAEGSSKKPLPCLCGQESTSLTQMKRHRSECPVWKNRDRGEVQMARLADTLQANHGLGVTHPNDVPGVEAKRKATLLSKYGAENVFCRESSIFDKVQASIEGKRPILRGSDNPFAWTEVQEKIRRANLERYGAENPQQVPKIRERTRSTNLERYGGELLASPILREKSESTNLIRYGFENPACSPEITERARQTNLARWGVEWTSQHPDVQARQAKTHLETYGSYYFVSEEGIKVIKETLRQRYGVGHPSQIEDFWDRTVATFVRRYGATHPLLLAEFLEKRRSTCQEKYGVDSPLQSPEVYSKLVATVQAQYGVDCVFQAKSVMTEEVKEKARQTNIANYGFPHPMMNREYAKAQLEKIHRPGPNLPERLLQAMAPELLYTGAGDFWKWLPLLGHHKNPDFILPGPDPENPKKDVVKVVELFGDFWHSRMFTGKANFEHESELILAFKEIGIECLVVWESEVKHSLCETRDRVLSFLHST